MTHQDDEELVGLSIRGDTVAFEALVCKYERPMFNTALRIINDYDDATDVTQAAFVKAWEHLKQFNRRYRFYSWLYRITVNESLTFITCKQRFERIDEGVACPEKTADQLFSDDETARNIQKALMCLSVNYRTVIVLSHFRELSYSEISDVLGISDSKVKSRLYTARQQLKSVLMRMGVTANGT